MIFAKVAVLALLGVACSARAEPPSRPTVAFALEAIRDRALPSLSISVVALEGLKGLSSLDPTLEITSAPDHRLSLRYGGRAKASYASPSDDDLAGWLRLIDAVSREAARRSRAIASADQDLTTEALIDGFLSKLDIFSHYAPPREARERRAARNGFGGVGVRYDSAVGGVTVTEVMKDSPASAAGLKVGDHIAAIDGDPLNPDDLAGIALKLRGPIGSRVRLALQQADGKRLEKTLTRSLIVPPSVTVTMDHGIALLVLSSFNQDSAASVGDAVRRAAAMPGFKGFVLDLRGNPGGLLDQAVAVADLFIATGRILVTRGRHPDAAQTQDAKSGDHGEGLPLVVLVDGGTASAAEILAADLQDLAGAVLVGTNSFGKGAIQTVLDLPNGGEMTLTWSRVYAPSGYALHGLGLLPAICTATGGKTLEDAKLAGGRAPPRSLFAEWRKVAPDDMQQRFHLRGHCPAGDHSGDQADLAIARQLLNDRALFARAQAVAVPMPGG